MTAEHPHLEAVRRLVADIPVGACWALTGSMNHVLQGVPLEHVGDIDVITDDAGLRLIDAALSDHRSQPAERKPGDHVSSLFATYELEGSAVEVMADMVLRLDDGTWSEIVDAAAQRMWVELPGMRIPLMDLRWECHFYERLGRQEREMALRRHLNRGDA